MWLWLLTPLELTYIGVPLALSRSLLVGLSVIRLVKRFAEEHMVTKSLLMGATAGYLHIGLSAGLMICASGTIQPGNFEPLSVTQTGVNSMLAAALAFSAINYHAFVFLNKVGFGDINPLLTLSRVISVVTSITGPRYLAAVMGVLIGRFASRLEHQNEIAG